jgi:phosphoglycolate phosphatase-like HAD superfamily hydrolase
MTTATTQKTYKTLVFDCDGVILDSNRIKTEAFSHVALQFGLDAAEQLVHFHVQNGGVSRYRKFEYLLVNILHRASDEKVIKNLANQYGQRVCEQLLLCPITPGLHELREMMPYTDWMVVSGGDQAELKFIFAERGLETLFNKGIYGSPSTKDEILSQVLSTGQLEKPGIFLGDSRYDHEAAKRAGLDFIFIHEWTEFKSWQDYCVINDIPVLQRTSDLHSCLKFFSNNI